MACRSHSLRPSPIHSVTEPLSFASGLMLASPDSYCTGEKGRMIDYHPRVASNASLMGNTIQGPRRSSHFRKARLQSSGASLPNTTEPAGTKGRSSAEATRMPYSWAKRSAARKLGKRDAALEVTILGGCEPKGRIAFVWGYGCSLHENLKESIKDVDSVGQVRLGKWH